MGGQVAWSRSGYLVAIAAILNFLATPIQAAMVRFSPTISSVVIGSTFSMNILGAGFNSGDLDGGGINFTYDSSVVSVLGVTINTADWEFAPSAGTINNIAGTVTGIVFNSFSSRTGSLTFATVQFSAVGASGSVSSLGLSEYAPNPFASGGKGYPGLSFDQTGSIAIVPLPSALWLFASAMMSLGGLARRLSPS